MRSCSKSRRRSAHGCCESDRGCPLGTVRVRPMWHASGTAGEEGASLKARRGSHQLGYRVRLVLGDHRIVGKAANAARQRLSVPLDVSICIGGEDESRAPLNC
jgi:hypothetical protein